MADDGDSLTGWVCVGVVLLALGGGGGTAATQASAEPKPRIQARVQKASVSDPTGTGGRVTPRMAALHAAMKARGYATGGAGCWDRHEWNPSSDHPRGRACDYSFNPNSPAQVARGWEAARWLTSVHGQYGVKYVIWQGQIWSTRRPAWKTYESGVYGCPNRRHVTGCHYDHIHVSVI